MEDDEIDAEAILRAFHKQKIGNPITIVSDGIEALELLRGATGHAKLTYPYLILLDINLPRMNGIEFLQTIRQDPILYSNQLENPSFKSSWKGSPLLCYPKID